MSTLSAMKTRSSTLLPALAAGLVAFAGGVRGGTSDGSCLESWELVNFQPRSPTHNRSVSSSSYHERATIVMFLASW